MYIASLPWYDLPASKIHLDAVHRQIRYYLNEGSNLLLAEQLDRRTPLPIQWSDSSLVLSQCCGPDLLTPAGQALKVIARPVFNTLDCPPGYYYSHIVTTSNNLSATPDIVVNSPSSFSGCTALLGWLRKTGREYNRYQISGSHTGSVECLHAGNAEVAAIDAYSWRLMKRDGLRVIDRSAIAPAPPFVSNVECGIDYSALTKAIDLAYRKHGKPLQLTKLLPADNQLYLTQQTKPEHLRTESLRSEFQRPVFQGPDPQGSELHGLETRANTIF